MSGLVVIIGSGEMGESMRSTHRRVFDHTGADSVTLLDTPYGFQENADALTERMVAHFRNAFDAKVEVASLRRPHTSESERQEFLDAISRAQVVFAGPGSPSYALRVWKGLSMRQAFSSVIERGGAVVMASAAALTLGEKAIPVYEIYKVGEDLHWVDGLDLLSSLGMKTVVVPHWNNREGGFHDTSHCFIGERRFRGLVEMLPMDTSVIGVEEHTSVLIDPVSRSMQVMGKGKAYLNDEPIDDGQELTAPALRPAFTDLAPEKPGESEPPEAEVAVIDLLVELRAGARDRYDFAESDRIRDALAQLDIEVHDHPDGTTWNRRRDDA
ncbi:MAG TPA: cysteinyl-tRNA synthetase [Acidimicrobiia bacterium]|nr:cysteinyl-tRNA synthetase [Acidimicrobiia bacterium]